MDLSVTDLDRLERRLDELRREYDLFFAGRRRGEPLGPRNEAAREVLRLTARPVTSTALRFRVLALAHRFRALEAQTRQLQQVRENRRRAAPREEPAVAPGPPSLVIDRTALADPAALATDLERLQSAVALAQGEKKAPTVEALGKRLFAEAQRQLDRPGVAGVRFYLATDPSGAVRIRGEVLPVST